MVVVGSGVLGVVTLSHFHVVTWLRCRVCHVVKLSACQVITILSCSCKKNPAKSIDKVVLQNYNTFRCSVRNQAS